MSKKPSEINDDEIRIIHACMAEKRNLKRHNLPIYLFIILGIIVIGGLVIGLIFRDTKVENNNDISQEVTATASPINEEDKVIEAKGFTTALDTTINKKGLLILSPENARPLLTIGTESLNDSNIILATQAADVRGDNGQIARAFVLNGELLSKGKAKAGYCSIINGELSIGIADATPKLEQALMDGGYFFRQFPLVVGGQIVENKPKGKAIRKALAEMGGNICVVISRDRLTFHDFSQLLIDAGVRNAIYLVGSSSYGFYVNEAGEKILTGKDPKIEYENINFIVWEQQ